MNSKLKLIEDNLDGINEAMDNGRPLMEIARNLGVKYNTLKSNLGKLGVEIKTNQNRKGLKHTESRKKCKDYLNGLHVHGTVVVRKMIEEGIKERRCEKCKRSEYDGVDIPLELHHINGNHYDNRMENLMIVCPNCHSIIHRSLNRLNGANKTMKKPNTNKSKPVYTKICENPDCGVSFKPKKANQRFCSQDCYKKCQKQHIPSKEELLAVFKQYKSFVGVGRRYNVSDNAIRKWLSEHDLPTSRNDLDKLIYN